MLKHWKSVLHCNECTYWTGFVCSWHPGRRLLFSSMKLAVKSVVLAFLCCKSGLGWESARICCRYFRRRRAQGALDLCFLPSDSHSSEAVYGSARCNQTQLESSCSNSDALFHCGYSTRSTYVLWQSENSEIKNVLSPTARLYYLLECRVLTLWNNWI